MPPRLLKADGNSKEPDLLRRLCPGPQGGCPVPFQPLPAQQLFQPGTMVRYRLKTACS